MFKDSLMLSCQHSLVFTFLCPMSWRPEQLAWIGLKKLRHCYPMYIVFHFPWTRYSYARIDNSGRSVGRIFTVHRLKKGPAYHWDMMVVALVNGILAYFGLPLVHGGLPHSPLHVRAMADVEDRVSQGHVYLKSVALLRHSIDFI